MAFKNRIRLPFELVKPQFPEERESFRKANGVVKTLSVVIRKTYEGATDFWPEKWHERFKIAMGHDNVRVEGEKYLGDIAQDGEYEIQWPDFQNYPTATARFKVNVTPFDASNSNCQTCEEATQLDLENDTFPDPLDEETEYEINVATNDTICCYPALFSVTSYNSDYLTSAEINDSGVLTIETGAGLVAANGILLATYRVTCPNGGYDEAGVYANINGSVEGCLAPTDLQVGARTSTTISYSWTAPLVGSLTYYYEIYEGESPVGSPVQSGTVTEENIILEGLDANTDYYFQVRQACESSDSNFIGIESSTTVEADSCGRYLLSFNDGTGVPSHFVWVSYRDCNFVTQAVMVYNNSSVNVCAQQTSPGVPVAINASGGVSVSYITSC